MVTELRDLLFHMLLDLFLEGCVLVQELMNRIHQIRGVVKERFQVVERVLRHVIQFIRFGSRHRLNTTYTGSNRSLHDNTYRTDTTGTLYVATATKLHRRTVLDDTHVVAVLLSEQRHRSHRFGFRNRSMTTLFQMQVLTNQRIRYALHLTQLFRGHFLEMTKVKTQALRGY